MDRQLHPTLSETIKKFEGELPSQEDIGRFYDEIDPSTYDEMLRMINYTEGAEIVRKISGARSDGGLGVGRDAAIFDAGMGTGLVGKALGERGYTRIDGGDASETFVDAARSSGAYRNARVMFFGNGVHRLDEECRGKYDVVTSSGTFLKAHFPKESIDDFHALMKPGGLFVTAMRSTYWQLGNEQGYREKWNELIRAGKLKLLETCTFRRGVAGDEHKLFKEQESTLVVFQKISD